MDMPLFLFAPAIGGNIELPILLRGELDGTCGNGFLL